MLWKFCIMNINELSQIIAAEGRNLSPDVVPISMPKIFAIVGHPDPMPDELLIKLRHLISKGATVVFLRDDEDLTHFQKMAELVLVESLPLPEPSDLERINEDLILRTHEQLVIDSDLFESQCGRNYFIPRNQRIPANCKNFNRNIGLNRKILKKWDRFNFWTDFF